MYPNDIIDIKLGYIRIENCIIEKENINKEIKNMCSLPMIEIEAQETADGKIRIIDIRNMLTQKELKDLGDEFFRIYSNGNWMYKCADSVYIYHPQYSGRFDFDVNTLFTKEKFHVLIKIMKQIGQRFMDIRKKVHEVETKNKTFVVQI